MGSLEPGPGPGPGAGPGAGPVEERPPAARSARLRSVDARAHERRWWILAVLNFSLLVIVLDNSILNVALPSIVRELHASNSQLQWIVDSYTLVFAGLLLTAGSLGDRFGRRGALQLGFVLFGLGSLASALVDSAPQLIVARAFTGIGGAFIMPATLSIITNVFQGRERARAIAIWAATAGAAGALGPLVGGFLLEHFYWGSVFLVNLPIVAVGLLAGFFLIPDSKDPNATPLDPVGAALSFGALVSLLYGLIEAPSKGWTDDQILGALALGALLLVVFLAWERRSTHPMLDLTFFRNPRFSGASAAVMLTFFAMFGSIFLFTQYLQFVLGYTPLQTGVRLFPQALAMMIAAPMSARLVERVGTKAVVAAGLGLVTAGLVLMSMLDADSPYSSIWWRLVVMATGMGLTMAPATESIMGSLPLGKAGVGSAVNDTTRQVGGAVGVAVIGSIFSSIYGHQVADALAGQPVPPAIAEGAKGSVGFALQLASRLPGEAGVALADAARHAFMEGFHAGVLVGAAGALVGAIVVLAWLPARERADDVVQRDAEYVAQQAATLGLAMEPVPVATVDEGREPDPGG